MLMQTIALIIFIITYIGIIFTRLPKMNIDRPSAKFFGAVAMILSGVLNFNEAIAANDSKNHKEEMNLFVVKVFEPITRFFNNFT